MDPGLFRRSERIATGGGGLHLQAVISLILSGFFFVSATVKAMQPGATMQAITELPGWSIVTLDEQFVILGVIIVEYVLAALLMLTEFKVVFAACFMFLLVVSGAIVALMLTGSNADCGCGVPSFGESVESRQLFGLTRNAVLAFLVWVVWRSPATRQS